MKLAEKLFELRKEKGWSQEKTSRTNQCFSAKHLQMGVWTSPPEIEKSLK